MTTTTRYLYDGFNIVAEYDGNNNVKAQYIQNLGIDDQLAMIKNGQTYYYHKDGLGSITKISDSNGSVVQSYAYDSFGNITNQTGSLIQPFMFTGREYDSETGMYYYRARTFDQKTGTFISKDPIGFEAGDVNLYRYVGNSPLNYTDPYGLFWPIDCYKCWRDSSKIDKATDKCRNELLNNKSDNMEDELEADIKFIEKYNGTDYGSAIWNCAQEKTGDKKIWKKAAANCFKCGFLQGPKTPTMRR